VSCCDTSVGLSLYVPPPQVLCEQTVELVFTAHPTQAFRQSLLKKYAKVRQQQNQAAAAAAAAAAASSKQQYQVVPAVPSSSAMQQYQTAAALPGWQQQQLHQQAAGRVRTG